MNTDWLARRARLSSSTMALANASGGGETTFAEWNARCNRTARWLEQAHGVKRGASVAVLADSSQTWLDVWLACGKLGAVLLPLNARLAAPSQAALRALAGEPLLLCGSGHEERAELLGGRTATFAALEAERDGLDPGDRPSAAALDDPWVYCATGGSTGQPKLAVLSHANVLWNAAGTAASWGLGPRHVALLNAPLFHTGGLNVFTAPLVWCGGASLVAPRFDPEEVLRLVDAGAITHFFGVPTMFLALQSLPGFDAVDWSRVELVISGGAPCPEPVFERFWALGVPFKTGYGLTEAGPNNFWLPDDEVRRKPGAVGYPLLHVETRVVDEAGRPAPEGTAGELQLRGPHVISGYLGNPEATAAALADGWLRTGDLAVQDADGCHRIVGRKKEMFISGGENVFPAEIESVLHGHPEVVAAAVVGVPHERWGEVGCAFVVLRDARALEELAGFLEPKLAGYQRPKEWVVLDALPLTGAGKVDKVALARLRPTSI